MVLDDLRGDIDRLYGEGPGAYADGPSIRELLALQARMGALVAEAVAAFDARGEWSLTGARSATAWLRAEARLSGKEARAQVRRGRGLRHLPGTAGAFEEGAITADQVDVLVSLRDGAREEALARTRSSWSERPAPSPTTSSSGPPPTGGSWPTPTTPTAPTGTPGPTGTGGTPTWWRASRAPGSGS